MIKTLKSWLAATALLLLTVSAQAENLSGTPAAPQLVVVIDDIGYNLPLGKRAAELPGAITYGVIPHTPLARKLAFYAIHNNPNKEIIVHMPMESSLDKALGDGALTDDLNREEFIATLRAALHDVPFAGGLSNHMGSMLTALPDRMQWLMGELERRDYFFLNSKTSTTEQPRAAAQAQHVPYLRRDVFLDHDPAPQALALAYNKALQLARERGLAVLVAHPYPATLDFLEQRLPRLSSEGVALVTASKALGLQRPAPLLAAARESANTL